MSATTSELHFRELGELLDRLSSRARMSSQHKECCRELLLRAKGLASQRNKAIHSSVVLGPEGPVLAPIREVARRTAPQEISGESLNKLDSNLRSLNTDLWVLHASIVDEKEPNAN